MASDPDLKFEFIVDVPRVDFHHPYWSEFKSFIKKMRLELQEKGRYSHDRPVLPLQRKPPTEWFHITLKTKEHPEGITLRIRRDNIYLDGYRMEDSGQWFEFDGPEQLIPGSTFLGFNGSYPSLEREGGRKDSIKLGQSELIVAVHDLATSTNKRMRAVALIIVIQMICESIRYDSILDQIVKKLRAVLPPPVMELENNWDKLSGALLSADDNQVVDFSKFDKMNIRTEKEAAAAVGMVLGLEEQDLDPLPSRKGRANKLVVGCYSFWQVGACALLQKLHPFGLSEGGGDESTDSIDSSLSAASNLSEQENKLESASPASLNRELCLTKKMRTLATPVINFLKDVQRWDLFSTA